MKFDFKHPVTGETKRVEVSDDMIRTQFEEVAYELLSECNCEPEGETNVADCDCSDRYEDFVLLPSAE